MFVHNFMVLTWPSGIDHTQLMRTWWVAIFYYLWCGDSGECLKFVDDLSLPRRNVSLNGMGRCAISHETLKGWWDPRLHFVVYAKKHLPQWPTVPLGSAVCRNPNAIFYHCTELPLGSIGVLGKEEGSEWAQVWSVHLFNCAFICLLSSRNYLYLCKCCY